LNFLANQQAHPPQGYPYQPVPQQHTVQVSSNMPKPPAYADVAPAQV